MNSIRFVVTNWAIQEGSFPGFFLRLCFGEVAMHVPRLSLIEWNIYSSVNKTFMDLPVGAARWPRPVIARGERSNQRTASDRPMESPSRRTEWPFHLPHTFQYPLLILSLTTGDPWLEQSRSVGRGPIYVVGNVIIPVVFTLNSREQQSRIIQWKQWFHVNVKGWLEVMPLAKVRFYVK